LNESPSNCAKDAYNRTGTVHVRVTERSNVFL
jgi:hypothetical protein